LAQASERLLDDQFRIGIERARGFVEDQDAWILENRARDRQPLTFPSRKPVAALPDDRVVAIGKRGDDLVNLSLAGGSLDLDAGGRRLSIAQILEDTCVEEERILRNDGDVGAQRLFGDALQAHAVD